MAVIPEYLVYDELRRREEAERDGGLVPLHLPLYYPDFDERPEERPQEEETDAPRGVVIIDMNSGDVLSE